MRLSVGFAALMAEYRLSPAAERDLEEIWQYTHREWGLEQAEKDWRFTRTAVYCLPDGSLVSFGSTESYGGTAAVEWISADLAVKETKVFMPTHGAGQIDAVAPTSRADEFATVRLLEPGLRHKVGPDETRSGILLAFLRFQ